MRVLITGGAGFIGSHLAEYLLSQGHSVHIFDNLSTGRLANVHHLSHRPDVRITVGDITDPAALGPAAREADSVVHLAAAVGVRLIMEKPVETIVTNVAGTEYVLKFASQRDLPVFVASTSEVYGKLMETDDTIDALREDGDWRLGPTSKRRWAYACSKALDEFLALAYYDEKKLPVVCGRFFNTVGPRQTGQYGMVIPNFVQRALLDEPILIYGDGEQTRCFNHVADAVRAVALLMADPKAIGQVFNIGNTYEISMNDLAGRIKEMTGSRSEIVHVPYDQVFKHGFEDMRRRTPDLSKITGAIGWTPTRSIDDILRDVIESVRHDAVSA